MVFSQNRMERAWAKVRALHMGNRCHSTEFIVTLHAFRKPVILITQNIAEVPFDLKSYRLLEYGTHFATMDESREKLATYAKGAKEQTIQFGSPVTDFLPASLVIADSSQDLRERDEPGYLDHLITINEGYSRLSEIIKEVTTAQEEMNQATNSAADELQNIAANPNKSSPAAARNVSRRLAERMEGFTALLRKANTEYAGVAGEMEDSLEHVVTVQLEREDAATNPEIAEQLEVAPEI